MSVARELNNLQAQISQLEEGTVVQVQAGTNVTITGSTAYPVINATGVASGVSSLTAGGAGLLVSPSTGDVIIKNTGVTSLTAGTGISVSGTGSLTVTNTGITSLTAGTGIGVSGSTITNNGVRTLTAGANITISGTATDPIITSNPPTPVPTTTPRDLAGSHTYTLTASQLNNSVLYSSVAYTSGGGAITINLPTYADMVATYGGNNLIPFFLGDLNIGSGQIVDVYLNTTGDPSLIWINNSVQGNSISALQNYSSAHPTPYALPVLQMYKGTAYINSVKGTVSYQLDWFGFAN